MTTIRRFLDRIMLLDASVSPGELADAALSVAMERRRRV